jgi:hypothetical protein
MKSTRKMKSPYSFSVKEVAAAVLRADDRPFATT